MSQKTICPKCGSGTVLPIIYGYPDGEAVEAELKAEIKLGGCVIEEDNPDYHCSECGHEWKK